MGLRRTDVVFRPAWPTLSVVDQRAGRGPRQIHRHHPACRCRGPRRRRLLHHQLSAADVSVLTPSRRACRYHRLQRVRLLPVKFPRARSVGDACNDRDLGSRLPHRPGLPTVRQVRQAACPPGLDHIGPGRRPQARAGRSGDVGALHRCRRQRQCGVVRRLGGDSHHVVRHPAVLGLARQCGSLHRSRRYDPHTRRTQHPVHGLRQSIPVRRWRAVSGGRASRPPRAHRVRRDLSCRFRRVRLRRRRFHPGRDLRLVCRTRDRARNDRSRHGRLDGGISASICRSTLCSPAARPHV